MCVCSVAQDSLQMHGLQPTNLLYPWKFPGKNTEAGCHSFLQGIFLPWGLNLGPVHCRWTLYHLSHCTILSGKKLLYHIIWVQIKLSFLFLKKRRRKLILSLPLQLKKSIKGNKYLNPNIGVNIINHCNIEYIAEYPLKYTIYWIPYFQQPKL